MDALKIAATGMMAQQLNVEVLSNNIANLNTTAFKRQRASFHDLMYKNPISVGATTSASGTIAPTGAQVGLGVDIGAIYKVFSQGSLTTTGNGLDFAIKGRGFFKIVQPNGDIAYTRDGAFQVNQDGEVVNSLGYALDPGFSVPDNAVDLTVSESGIVTAKIDNSITELGQITVAMFVNAAGLENIGNNLMLETEASGTPTDVNPGEGGSGVLSQFHLENSNVDPIEAVTDLISAQRAYELNSRVISTADEMLSAVNQIR